jgi:hypothetical protein
MKKSLFNPSFRDETAEGWGTQGGARINCAHL